MGVTHSEQDPKHGIVKQENVSMCTSIAEQEPRVGFYVKHKKGLHMSIKRAI